jgi:glycosyltransferase involved in cell wall biosynthesis
MGDDPRVRVLHLCDRLTERGGAYQHLLAVLERQVADGHAVHLAVGQADPGARAPCAVRIVPGLETRTPVTVDLADAMAAARPDVVHLHTVVNPEVLGWAASVPAVVTVQDHRAFCPGRGKWTLAGGRCTTEMSDAACAACFEDAAYFRDTLDLTRRRLSALRRLRVLVLSRYMRDELVAVGLDGERVLVVPPFVRALPSAPVDGPPCVLFAGRLVEAKGVRDALDAWRRADLGVPLVAAGAGPLRPDLERAGAVVTGWVDRPRLAALFARAGALVMPSRWQEPFGIVGLEALSCGVPVAAWDSGGVAEWHPGDGLAPWGDSGALGDALRRVFGTRAEAPDAFRPGPLMARLYAAYARAAAGP